MANPEQNPIPRTTDVVNLSCMEIWGGNRNIQESFPLPGIDTWLRARAYAGTRGGDIHYLSTCAHSEVLRFAVADVAGHGAEVADVASRFKRLIVKHINKLDQSRLAKALNAEFYQDNEGGRFVTTLLTSYYRPTGHLVICNAGHPRPMIYRAASQTWELIDHGTETKVEELMNLPLGIIEPTDYYQFAIRLYPGDYVVLYSDGFSDVRRAGIPLGEQGLLDTVRALNFDSASDLGEKICTSLGMDDEANVPIDDETLIVLAPKEHMPPRFPLKTRLKVMAKMLGVMRIQ
jgi:sigma-B regulation protein RsbU (phosphoserine phosphatase)